MNIRIIKTPAGEAPLWVREKWVGLELPLSQRLAMNFFGLGIGVLTGPQTIFGMLIGAFTGKLFFIRGYKISVLDAIEVLEKASPEAAAWWKLNTPHLAKPRKHFLFRKEECQIV
jgi:hypothetical protein